MARVLIVGAGSIGLRHAKVLGDSKHEISFLSSRRDLDFRVFGSLQQSLEIQNPEVIVIANDTNRHEHTLSQLIDLNYRGAVLVEKPLNVHSKTLFESKKPKFRLGVAFNLRFHPLLQELTNLLAKDIPISITIYAGQDLRTWRPKRELSLQYSIFRERGGGVLRDLSHELDYVSLLAGKIESLVSNGGRQGSITFDADDSWSILMTTERVPQITLNLNYFDNPGARIIRAVSQLNTYVLDLNTSTLSINGGEPNVYEMSDNLTYERMHHDFIYRLGKTATLEDATVVDNLVKAIERSAKKRKWINV